MRKLLISSTLAACLLLLAPTANAALTPVTGSMSVAAYAQAEGQSQINNSDSAVTTQSGSAFADAMSMGTPPDPDTGGGDDDDGLGGGGIDEPPMLPMEMLSPTADAMSDASITIRENGFFLQANGHSGVSDGAGLSGASAYLTHTFLLDTRSSCAFVTRNDWNMMYGGEAASASIYLQNAAGEKLIELTNPTSEYIGILVLDPGQYTVVGNINCVTESYGENLDGSGYFEMDLTATAVVPEPFTLSLFGFGGLLTLRKRK